MVNSANHGLHCLLWHVWESGMLRDSYVKEKSFQGQVNTGNFKMQFWSYWIASSSHVYLWCVVLLLKKKQS